MSYAKQRGKKNKQLTYNELYSIRNPFLLLVQWVTSWERN
ncbi:hypothetical protein HMPREF0653_02049 [Prevotella disiens JCM 6334 = ATCC 29426]|uniref:Uncharacterized protein n=1 Tax=Prevotella disiens JCM 6334 = ATCC 29426 TaxID=1235811 RepID=A0ABN0NQB3_9BACT|nr:hypothetical protein HMPREF0653_02049 [Prevotella disiens JCM 6334 = ATCC 29426]